jgi:hypothetical protein
LRMCRGAGEVAELGAIGHWRYFDRAPEMANPAEAVCRHCCWSRFRAMATFEGEGTVARRTG